MKRKDFLKWIGLGGAGAVAGGGLVGLLKGNRTSLPIGYGSAPESTTPGSLDCVTDASTVAAEPGTAFQPTYQSSLGPAQATTGRGLEVIGNSYGSMVHPPAALGRDYLSAFERESGQGSLRTLQQKDAASGVITYTAISDQKSGLLPPVRSPGGVREFKVDTIDRPLNVAHGSIFRAWTFNGSVPGPIMRATEGETLKIHFNNLTSMPHSLHFHGTHDVNFDGWEPIPPGKSTEYIIKAGPPGIHPYHCHTAPIDTHIARGLLGALIVDPSPARPPAREVVLVLNGYDLSGRGRNDLFCWNGIAGFYDRYPIRVKVGELVRIYVVNMVEFDPIASFHLHAQTFDVYRTGTRMTPDEHTDIVTLGQTERAILEVRFERKGRYMFHPHQSYMAAKGAMGWFVAV